MKLKVLSVSQLNDSLSSYIYANPIFSSIRVMGEIFNLKKTPYGYTFLSLKDDMSKISAMTYLEDFDVKVSSITEEYSASYDPDEESELVEVINESVDEAETGFEEEVVVAQEIVEERTHVVVSQEVLDMADDFLESISELFGMTEEHNDNVSTEVVSETSVNEVVEAGVEVYEEISLFDFV